MCRAGVALLGAGCLIQLYVAGVNYARNSPEGYSPVADAKVSLQPVRASLLANKRATRKPWALGTCVLGRRAAAMPLVFAELCLGSNHSQIACRLCAVSAHTARWHHRQQLVLLCGVNC